MKKKTPQRQIKLEKKQYLKEDSKILEDGKQMRQIHGWMTNGWVDDRWLHLFNRYLFVEFVPDNFHELKVQLTFLKGNHLTSLVYYQKRISMIL